MITAFGHADLAPEALCRLELLFRSHLEQLPTDATVVVRAAAGLPLALGRAAHTTGHQLVVALPAQQGLPVPLPPADREAATQLVRLATLIQLQTYAPDQRASRITADERILAGCGHALAVWDGSPSTGADATAHLVAYARGRGINVEHLWTDSLRRLDTPVGQLVGIPRHPAPSVGDRLAVHPQSSCG